MRLPVELIDEDTGEAVEAEVFDEVTVEHFIETQTEWRPVVVEAARTLAKQGRAELIPQHWFWDWRRKAPMFTQMGVVFYGLSCRGKLQGLMEVQTGGLRCRCRLPEQAGKPLVYVDYLEVAPWNIYRLMESIGQKAQFSAVGRRLLEVAVRLSIDEEFQGRVGLHLLPVSEGFYQSAGMIAVGRDPAKENLLWCEFTPEQAKKFLPGESQ